MSKLPLETMKELNDDFLEWFNETSIKFKNQYSNPTEMKNFFKEDDEGSYYIQSNTQFSAHLLVELIRYLGYHKSWNVYGYYHMWTMMEYEKINWILCFEQINKQA